MDLFKDSLKQHGPIVLGVALVATYAAVALVSFELKQREMRLHPADADRQFHLRLGVLAALSAAVAWRCATSKSMCKLVALCATLASGLFALGVVYPRVVLQPGLLMDTELRSLYMSA